MFNLAFLGLYIFSTYCLDTTDKKRRVVHSPYIQTIAERQYFVTCSPTLIPFHSVIHSPSLSFVKALAMILNFYCLRNFRKTKVN